MQEPAKENAKLLERSTSIRLRPTRTSSAMGCGTRSMRMAKLSTTPTISRRSCSDFAGAHLHVCSSYHQRRRGDWQLPGPSQSAVHGLLGAEPQADGVQSRTQYEGQEL